MTDQFSSVGFGWVRLGVRLGSVGGSVGLGWIRLGGVGLGWVDNGYTYPPARVPSESYSII